MEKQNIWNNAGGITRGYINFKAIFNVVILTIEAKMTLVQFFVISSLKMVLS